MRPKINQTRHLDPFRLFFKMLGDFIQNKKGIFTYTSHLQQYLSFFLLNKAISERVGAPLNSDLIRPMTVIEKWKRCGGANAFCCRPPLRVEKSTNHCVAAPKALHVHTLIQAQ
jgi:hypothetical protein